MDRICTIDIPSFICTELVLLIVVIGYVLSRMYDKITLEGVHDVNKKPLQIILVGLVFKLSKFKFLELLASQDILYVLTIVNASYYVSSRMDKKIFNNCCDLRKNIQMAKIL